MACFATPYGLHYAAHCFNRAYAQNNRPALIPAGGKLGVTSQPAPGSRQLPRQLAEGAQGRQPGDLHRRERGGKGCELPYHKKH